MSEVSREITKLSGRINQTFGGPYYSSLITTHHYYLHAYKYLYRNPIEAGLAAQSEEYKFSSLHGLLGFSRLLFPLLPDDTLFNDVEGTLAWINQSYLEGHRETVKRALRRNQFSIPLTLNRKASALETNLS